jgi:hypothetical protein
MVVKVSAYFVVMVNPGGTGSRCASFRGDSRLCRPAAISSRLIHPRGRRRSSKRNAAFSFFSCERGDSAAISVSLMCAEVIFEP